MAKHKGQAIRGELTYQSPVARYGGSDTPTRATTGAEGGTVYKETQSTAVGRVKRTTEIDPSMEDDTEKEESTTGEDPEDTDYQDEGSEDDETEEELPEGLSPSMAFRWILEYRVGFTHKDQIRVVTRIIGVNRVEDLRFMTKELLVQPLENNSTGMSRLRLLALRKFAQEEWNNYGQIDLKRFTQAKMDAILEDIAKGKKGSNNSKPRSASSTPKDSDLKRFSGKPEHWEDSKTNLVTHLNLMQNDVGVPLYYVIRDPSDEALYRANQHNRKPHI